MKTYPLKDNPSLEERPAAVTKRHLRGALTGEYRCPQKGEWYLSGAIPEGYKAPNNLSLAYHILRLVPASPAAQGKIEKACCAELLAVAPALITALSALIETVEATGGLTNVGPDERPSLAPAADDDWLDLADAYLLACKALNRLPKIDANPNPFAIQPKSQKRQEEKP